MLSFDQKQTCFDQPKKKLQNQADFDRCSHVYTLLF